MYLFLCKNAMWSLMVFSRIPVIFAKSTMVTRPRSCVIFKIRTDS